MNVSVVGAGRVGTAVAVLLMRAGHRIVAVSGRASTRDRASRHLPEAPILDPEETCRRGELVLIAVPDDEIVPMVERLAEAGVFREGQWAVHLSGAAGLEALEPARRAGARTFVLHPLQTFPTVAAALERLPGSSAAVTAADTEGYVLGERIAWDLGARPFRLDDGARPLYHAAAVFASNYLIVTAAVAEDLFREAGVPDPAGAMAPLLRASLENVAELGPALALTGPAVRGDATTVDRNLSALHRSAPWAVPAYVELCRLALELGTRTERLAAEGRAAVEEVLAGWS